MKRHELLQREVHDASGCASLRARQGAGSPAGGAQHHDAAPVLAGRFFVPLVPFCRRTDGELLSSANDALQQLTQVPADYVDIRVIQGWINLRAILTQGDRAILQECARADELAMAAYHDFMRKTSNYALIQILQRQVTAIGEAHDQLVALTTASPRAG